MDKDLTCRAATNIAWFQVGLAWASANLLVFLYLSPRSEKRPIATFAASSAKMPPSAWARCWSPSLSFDAWPTGSKRKEVTTCHWKAATTVPQAAWNPLKSCIQALTPAHPGTWCCPGIPFQEAYLAIFILRSQVISTHSPRGLCQNVDFVLNKLQ